MRKLLFPSLLICLCVFLNFSSCSSNSEALTPESGSLTLELSSDAIQKLSARAATDSSGSQQKLTLKVTLTDANNKVQENSAN